ncbi:MAG TPA: hypothetical protein VK599_07105 [Streptosporangiaceae bacterium]|nr:hypothetical protein [Streptosporangiaceae bacterium]
MLVLPGSRWRDDWKLTRHHLRDMVLSRRFRADEVLTLPAKLSGRPLAGAVLRVSERERVIKTPGFIQDPGDQRVRISRAR